MVLETAGTLKEQVGTRTGHVETLNGHVESLSGRVEALEFQDAALLEVVKKTGAEQVKARQLRAGPASQQHPRLHPPH